MENELLNSAVSYGIFAVLFCYLLFYVLKTQEKRDEKSQLREEKYEGIICQNQIILEELTQKLNIIEDVKGDIREIKSCVSRKKR